MSRVMFGSVTRIVDLPPWPFVYSALPALDLLDENTYSSLRQWLHAAFGSLGAA